MADIPQWRRKIPPSRSRTPMLEFTEPDQDVRSAAPTRPSTPKKGLRPKLSSYLSQSGPFGVASKSGPEPEPVFADPPPHVFPSWAVEDTFPNPGAEQLVDTILCHLMSQPYDALDVRFNGSLLQIFEAYRDLLDQRDRLEKSLAEEVAIRQAERSAVQDLECKWEEEIQTYKAEVKRLEIVIAKGKRGVAEVALVRQDSLIRRRKQATTPDDEDDGKETVFEFLEKTKRFEDPAWSGQRATMKIRPASPSARMAKLSRKLTKKISKTSILAELPFGTPPPHIHGTSLLQASYMEDQARLLEKRPAESQPQTRDEPRVSFSDSTTSTFSCAGDLLPDESNDKGFHSGGPSFDDVSDNDIEDIRQMAATISSRRGIDTESVMPRLLDLFRPQSALNNARVRQPNETRLQGVVTAPVASSSGAVPVRRPSHLMGFINRLRPQLSLETLPETRRFSFEVGDDSAAIGVTYQNPTSRESLLRKSVSLSALPEAARRVPATTARNDLSPIESSPTGSVHTSDSRKTSKIPSPSYNAALAKPRQERENSASSLLIAMGDTDHSGQRSSSAASSVYSSHSYHHVATDRPRVSSLAAFSQPGHASRLEYQRRHGLSSFDAAGTGPAPSRQLVDHTNAVRAGTSIGGSTISVRDSGSAVNSDMKVHSPTRGDGGRSRTTQIASTQLKGAVSENSHPFLQPLRSGNDDDAVAEDRRVLQ